MDRIKVSDELYHIFKDNSLNNLFYNIKTSIQSYQVDNIKTWATVNTEIIDNNCYSVSPYAFIINYANVEIIKIPNKTLRFFLKKFLYLLGYILRVVQIDKIQILNNYILSTNMFSDIWNTASVTKLREKAIKTYKYHTLAIRSLNIVQNHTLIENLYKDGWIPIVTRQIYILNYKDIDMKKRNLRRDMRLLDSLKYEFISPDIHNFEHFQKAEELYNELYIGKYTKENIQYTAQYMYTLYKQNILNLKLLKDKDQNIFVGVVGFIIENKAVTVPILGYSLKEPQKAALYRRCSVYPLNYAYKNNLLSNMSSGAPYFKENRGASPQIEYMFTYIKHLPFYRRLIWNILSLLSLKVYKPILQKNKL